MLIEPVSLVCALLQGGTTVPESICLIGSLPRRPVIVCRAIPQEGFQLRREKHGLSNSSNSKASQRLSHAYDWKKKTQVNTTSLTKRPRPAQEASSDCSSGCVRHAPARAFTSSSEGSRACGAALLSSCGAFQLTVKAAAFDRNKLRGTSLHVRDMSHAQLDLGRSRIV